MKQTERFGMLQFPLVVLTLGLICLVTAIYGGLDRSSRGVDLVKTVASVQGVEKIRQKPPRYVVYLVFDRPDGDRIETSYHHSGGILPEAGQKLQITYNRTRPALIVGFGEQQYIAFVLANLAAAVLLFCLGSHALNSVIKTSRDRSKMLGRKHF